MSGLEPAVEWLRAGRIVAFPTDTFYGLAADPLSPSAVQALFDLKGRDAHAAVPLVAASLGQIEAACGPLPPSARRLAERFWPGPLSLIVDAPPSFAPDVHGGRHSVAVRVPDHALARALCGAWGGLLTATSANRSGQAPAADPAELADLARDGRLFVIDGGKTPGGQPSTIVDARGDAPALVRAGSIAWDRVLDFLQE